MTKRGGARGPDLARFSRIVKARRQALGLNQEEVNALGGPSDTTFTKIENLTWRPGRNSTLGKLDAGLKWEVGSSARILYDGGDPMPLQASPRIPAPETTSDPAGLAIQVIVLLEFGLLDAAASLLSTLALELAGGAEELTRRRQEVRARMRLRLDDPAAASEGSLKRQGQEIQYRNDGSLDPDQIRLARLSDPDVIAEINRRSTSGDRPPEGG